jgi:hypothetical protein
MFEQKNFKKGVRKDLHTFELLDPDPDIRIGLEI